jgi:serine/threonine-protein kinase
LPLSPGTRLGVYDIAVPIGEGGMGQVYRATDTTLGRQVAIKILPDAFASDPERLARFEREAKTLASLNHPHIAAIYGFEKSGGLHALVMELVDGEDLSQRIGRGAIPIDEALPIAKQIAEALEAAHEQGIIHRDLKPANIKVRADGTVKVLDFGLAKAMDPTASSSGNSMNSPTLSMHATQAGIILGTAAYMAPEQARGKTVDRRADIWAFGAVLFEMLSGSQPFPGEDISHVLARVIERDPDWNALPPNLSPALGMYLRRCLVKDPRQRIRDIGDVRLALDGAFETTVPHAASAVVTVPRSVVARALPWALVTTLTLALVVDLVWALWRSTPVPAPRLARFELPLPAAETLAIASNDHDFAISPDGTGVVYKVAVGGPSFLTVRAMDALTARPLQGLPQGIYNPFISPDGAWVGFSDEGDGSLKKVSMLGGPAVRICMTGASTAGIDGASWGDDDTIVFALNKASGLWRVPAGGGTPKELTKLAPGQVNHAWPEMLPGSRAVLFTILNGPAENAQIAVLNLVTGELKVLVSGGSYPRYARTGHIVYGIGGTLRAVPFDLKRLEVAGAPVPVLDGVITKDAATSPVGLGAADFALAEDGSLVYLSGDATGGLRRTLVWVDRHGHETPLAAPPREYIYPRLSPDGTRVAVVANDQEHDIWIWDLSRTTLTRATFDPGADTSPVWTPDGRRLIFSSARAGELNLYWQAADGTGALERLAESPNRQMASAVSPDGRRLIFTEDAGKTGQDVMQVELDGTHRASPLVQSRFIESEGAISPDGRWLAYQATDSGRTETYVRPYPAVNSGYWQVSTAGGAQPLWARNGQELFYVSPAGAIMRVGVERGPSWVATPPTMLVKEGYATRGNRGRMYDISSDGQRFLMIKDGGTPDQAASTPKIIVVQHWTEELKRLVPTK